MHLVSTIEAMGYGALTPTALQRFLSTRSANASVEFTPYTEEVEGGPTRDDIATLLQLVYLKLTSPRLDPARLESSRAALKGYLAGMSNSPQRQFEDFSMAVLSQDHPRARRVPTPADLDRVNAERSVAMFRERFGNASGMTFVLVGSFSIAEVKPLVARYLGGLPSTPREAHFRDVGVRYPSGDIDRTLQKGSDNSAVTIIYSGVRPYSADEALKLEALTEVLRLRVVDRIREELGTSYSPGVVSQFARVPVGEYAAPVLGRLFPRRGAHRRAHHRRDHQGVAGEGPDGRGTREGHPHLAERGRRPHEDEPVPGQAGSAPGRWIRPWTMTSD